MSKLLPDTAGSIPALVSTTQLAEMLKTSNKVITENAKKCLPLKIIENGKVTFYDEAEVTVLIDYMKKNNNRKDTLTFTTSGIASTSLSPALEVTQLTQQIQASYQRILEIANFENERLREENKIQSDKLTLAQPKIEFYDTVTDSKDAIGMGEAAKTLHLPYGRNKLFQILRDKGIFMNDNVPYQRYVDSQYFRVIETKYTIGDSIKIHIKTLVTQRGLEFIKKVVKDIK